MKTTLCSGVPFPAQTHPPQHPQRFWAILQLSFHHGENIKIACKSRPISHASVAWYLFPDITPAFCLMACNASLLEDRLRSLTALLQCISGNLDEHQAVRAF